MLPKEIEKTIFSLSHCSEKILPEEKIQILKKFAKENPEKLTEIYKNLMVWLRSDHSQIRLNSLKIVEILFERSHKFREILIENFQEFLICTVETENLRRPLPPPKQAAKELKQTALKLVDVWHRKFGPAYRQLEIGYRYLRACKEVDFNDLDAETRIEKFRTEEKIRRQAEFERRIYERVLAHYDSEFRDEIHRCLMETESALQLIFPDFSVSEEKTENSGNSWNLRENATIMGNFEPLEVPVNVGQFPVPESPENFSTSGNIGTSDNIGTSGNIATSGNIGTSVNSGTSGNIGTSGNSWNLRENATILGNFEPFEVPVNVGQIPVPESSDNEAILATLKDSAKLLANRFLPKICKFLKSLSKIGPGVENSQNLLKNLIILKEKIQSAISKCKKLKIIFKSEEEKEKEEEDFFEEVEDKEGLELGDPLADEVPKFVFEASKIDQKRSKISLEEKFDEPGPSREFDKPGTSSEFDKPGPSWEFAGTSFEGPGPSFEGPGSSFEGPGPSNKIPVLDYGLDLKYWGVEKIEPAALVRNDSDSHRFWRPTNDEPVVVASEEEAYRSRLIDFSGHFQPVERECGALMPDGKRCRRRDRFKCPFHGPLVPSNDPMVSSNDQMVSSSGPLVLSNDPMEGTSKDSPVGTLTVGNSRNSRNSKSFPAPRNPWEDPELLADIEAATGRNLRQKKRGKEKTEILSVSKEKKRVETSRGRLEAKILNKKAIKKVAGVMNELESKKHDRKFGHQWAYALGKF